MVASKDHSRLVIKHRRLYGCWRGARVNWVIFDAGRDVNNRESIRPFFTPATVAGHYAAAHLVLFGGTSDQDNITVVNLKTGRSRVGAPPADWGERTFMTVSRVYRLVLTRSGIAAWTSEGMNGFEVRVLKRDGIARLLDVGSAIDPQSLRLSGESLLWTDGGVERSEPLMPALHRRRFLPRLGA